MSIGFARGTWTSPFGALAACAFAAAVVGGNAARASEPIAAPSHAVRLFGSSENTSQDISPFPKWTGMLQRYAREQHLEDAPCAGGQCVVQEWKAFVMSLQGQERLSQLQAVNAYGNRIAYRADLDRHGIVDHWATPRETLGGSADCEDYAIIKYLSLRKLGWSASDLRIVVLKHELRNELHAVLVAYVNGTAYVLDNLISEVREHAAIRYYRPIFSINETAWHYHRDWNPASVVLVAKAAPAQPLAPVRAPQGTAPVIAAPAAPSRPAAQIASPLPPALDTVKVARNEFQPPLVRRAVRSTAANAGESLAALFTNTGAYR